MNQDKLIDWKNTTVSKDNTHHLLNGMPIYTVRFLEVLKFHSPGIAAVIDESGWYHIDVSGNPLYSIRFTRTFGYYQDRASVQLNDNWFHIDLNGNRSYENNYNWVGNYQYGYCVVRNKLNSYYHINLDGERIYQIDYIYAGDFKDDYAVIRDKTQLCTHIDQNGSYIHNKWFEELDIFHKGFARAKDSTGWFHIDLFGNPAYDTRFDWIEPFYNGQALVSLNEQRLIIDESGSIVLNLGE
jgi:hypothetical protein